MAYKDALYAVRPDCDYTDTKKRRNMKLSKLYCVYIPFSAEKKVELTEYNAEHINDVYDIKDVFLYVNAITSVSAFTEDDLDRDYRLQHGIAFYTANKELADNRFHFERDKKIKELEERIAAYAGALAEMKSEGALS